MDRSYFLQSNDDSEQICQYNGRARSNFLANILICTVIILSGMIFVVGAWKVILTQCYVYNYSIVIFFNDIMCIISFHNLISLPAYTISQSVDIFTLTRVVWGIPVSPCPSVRPPVCPSVDRILSALYILQYHPDPFGICTSYQPTLEDVPRAYSVEKHQNLNFLEHA